MKAILWALLLSCYAYGANAAITDTTTSEKSIKDKILADIQQNLTIQNNTLDSTIIKLDNRVNKLDSVIKVTGNPKERMDKLVERVQVLEDKQRAIEQNELNIYQANYQSAVINLVSMDREIKPLILFHTTREFFNTLTETANPVNYEGFQAGFGKFKDYVEKHKSHDATLHTVSDMVAATGSVSFGIPLVGAYSQLLFSGMAKYVNSIGHKKREMRKEAEKMFDITTALSQFNTDKNLIENEWGSITESLGEMQGYYDSVLNRNLTMLGASRYEFVTQFSRQSDADVRYQYLTALRQEAADYVAKQKETNPKNWKENIYYQLMDVQSLKMKYGDLTYRIRQHMGKYDTLIAHYKTNPQIGDHVVRLEGKLNDLKQTFDSAFEPSEYVHTATRMYKVM